jgi:hypothetical protein
MVFTKKNDFILRGPFFNKMRFSIKKAIQTQRLNGFFYKKQLIYNTL